MKIAISAKIRTIFFSVNEEEREEFFARLETLREQSETFLKMLNDMRRRLKELPANSPATQQYKCVHQFTRFVDIAVAIET